MIAIASDAHKDTVYDLPLGPLASEWQGIVNFPNNPDYPAILKRWFVETDLLPILKKWACNSYPIFTSDYEATNQAFDALAVAECWLWMLRDPDVNEHPDVMPKLSAAFETSCNNLNLYVRAFINEGWNNNYPSQLALAMMIERAKDELKTAQGWE